MSFYTFAEFSFLARQDLLAMASWAFFASGFLPRHPPVAPNRLSSSGRICSLWRTQISKDMVFGPPLPAMATDARRGELWSWKTWSLELHSRYGGSARYGELVFDPLFEFPSLIHVLFNLFLHNWVK